MRKLVAITLFATMLSASSVATAPSAEGGPLMMIPQLIGTAVRTGIQMGIRIGIQAVRMVKKLEDLMDGAISGAQKYKDYERFALENPAYVKLDDLRMAFDAGMVGMNEYLYITITKALGETAGKMIEELTDWGHDTFGQKAIENALKNVVPDKKRMEALAKMSKIKDISINWGSLTGLFSMKGPTGGGSQSALTPSQRSEAAREYKKARLLSEFGKGLADAITRVKLGTVIRNGVNVGVYATNPRGKGVKAGLNPGPISPALGTTCTTALENLPKTGLWSVPRTQFKKTINCAIRNLYLIATDGVKSKLPMLERELREQGLSVKEAMMKGWEKNFDELHKALEKL